MDSASIVFCSLIFLLVYARELTNDSIFHINTSQFSVGTSGHTRAYDYGKFKYLPKYSGWSTENYRYDAFSTCMFSFTDTLSSRPSNALTTLVTYKVYIQSYADDKARTIFIVVISFWKYPVVKFKKYTRWCF